MPSNHQYAKLLAFFSAALFLTISLWILDPEVEAQSDRTGYYQGDPVYDTARVFGANVGSGDLDNDGENEMALCDFQGNVILLDPDESGKFVPEVIWTEPGPPVKPKSLFDIRVDDIMLDRSGPEIIVGGDTNNLTVIYHEGGSWESDVIYRSPVQIWAITIGEFDSESEGEEIFLSSFEESADDRVLRYLKRGSGGDWIQEDIDMPYTVKAAEVIDMDPGIAGNEVWVTTSYQQIDTGDTLSLLLKVYHNGTNWTTEEIGNNSKRLIANLKGGDIWSGHSGNELFTVDFSGRCIMYWYDNGSVESREIFRATDARGSFALLEGMGVGDFNPLNDREEILVTGYYNDVHQIIDLDGEVEVDLIWSRELLDPIQEISGINVGNVKEDIPGNEVLVASRNGWVEVVGFEQDGINFQLEVNEIEMVEGSEKTITATIRPMGMMRGDVTISFSGDEDLNISIPSTITIEEHESYDFDITITAPEIDSPEKSYQLQIDAQSDGFLESGELDVDVFGVGKDQRLMVKPSTGSLLIEAETAFTSEVTFEGFGEHDSIDIIHDADPGLDVDLMTTLEVGESATLTVTAMEGAQTGEKSIQLSAVAGDIILDTATVSVFVYSLDTQLLVELDSREENEYSVDVDYLCPVNLENITMVVAVGNYMIETREVDLTTGKGFKLDFMIDQDIQGNVAVAFMDQNGEEIASYDLHEVQYVEIEEYGEDEEEFTSSLLFIALLIAIIIAVSVIVILLSYMLKPKKEREFTEPESRNYDE